MKEYQIDERRRKVLKTPLGYKTKSERRHYEKQAKRLEHFLNKLFTDIDRRLGH